TFQVQVYGAARALPARSVAVEATAPLNIAGRASLLRSVMVRVSVIPSALSDAVAGTAMALEVIVTADITDDASIGSGKTPLMGIPSDTPAAFDRGVTDTTVGLVLSTPSGPGASPRTSPFPLASASPPALASASGIEPSPTSWLGPSVIVGETCRVGHPQ